MGYLIAFILIILVIGAVLQSILVALRVIFLYILLPYIAISIIYLIIRTIYHVFSPGAKKSYLEKKANETEEKRKIKKREEVKAKAKKERKEANLKAEIEQKEAENRRREFEHQQHRDGDQQATPYKYKIGRHGNESLAIRYGIANQERKVKEYWYYAKGGEKRRNPDRDKIYYEPAGTIRLQKIEKLSKDTYEVILTDYRDRKGKAIIEVGTEYVKTFYPVDDSWFEKYADLEETLKGNNSFTLKELATFHVQKTVGI